MNTINTKTFGRKILMLALFSVAMVSAMSQTKKAGGYYQITVYNFNTAAQQTAITDYLKNAYLPALHKQKLTNIGVFLPLANDTSANKKLYIIIPLKSFDQAAMLPTKIWNDEQYRAAAKEYLSAVYNNAPYKRMETVLLEQFSMAPFFRLPKLTGNKSERIYELRSYESPTETFFKNKVEMFNEGGEIELFDKLNFNAVFYGKVVIGSHLPNLMYMTSFENMADREAHWKAFGASEDWKKLSSMPVYQNNVSSIEVNLMKAADFSDF